MAQEQYEEILERLYLQLTRGAARKRVFALRAQRDRDAVLALLFLAVAESDEAQSRRILFLLRGSIGPTKQNLAEISEQEIPSLQDRYRRLAEEGNRHGFLSLRHLGGQEERVARKNASLVRKGQDGTVRATAYHVCSFCGYVHEDEAPVQCPVCQAPGKRFRRITGPEE